MDATTERPTERCRWCLGTGKMTITVVANGTTSKPKIGCIYCKESGVLPRGFAKAYDQESERFLCSCGDKSVFGEWHEDGVCGDCDKHHAHCGRCGKISQIG